MPVLCQNKSQNKQSKEKCQHKGSTRSLQNRFKGFARPHIQELLQYISLVILHQRPHGMLWLKTVCLDLQQTILTDRGHVEKIKLEFLCMKQSYLICQTEFKETFLCYLVTPL